jgi:hypothetical protein
VEHGATRQKGSKQMIDHIPTEQEVATAVAQAKASPLFAAAYDAVFDRLRSTEATEVAE